VILIGSRGGKESPATTQLGRSVGFEFTTALCSSIESTTAGIERDDHHGFRYRGARLRFAVERALFVSMVNDEELYRAFVERGQGGAAAVNASRSRLEQAVARRLLAGRPQSGEELPRFSSGRIAEKLRYRGADLLDRTHAKPAANPRSSGSPVALLVYHRKFLRFLEPLRHALGPERTVMLSSFGRVPADPDGGEVRQRAIDYAAEPVRLEARAIGAALRGHAHLAADYDLLLRALAEVSPRCVVVVEGNAPHDELANRACKELGIPCVCLQQGWSPMVHTGFRNMSYTRMAIWGDGFRDLLAPHNPDQEFVVTGSPAFALEARERPLGDDPRCASFFFQGASQLIDERHLRQMMELVRRASERFTKDVILVREHPGAPFSAADREALERAPNIRLVPPDSHSLKDVLEASRVAVALYSTSLLEAAAAGTPALAFNTTSLPRYSPDIEEHGVGIETRDPDLALGALGRLLHDDAYHASYRPAIDRFRERFFAGADGHAAERIANLIDDLAAA
jgi:hypothetical protein